MRVPCGMRKVGAVNIPSQLALGLLRPHSFLRGIPQLTMVTGRGSRLFSRVDTDKLPVFQQMILNPWRCKHPGLNLAGHPQK